MTKSKRKQGAAGSSGPPAWRYRCRACQKEFKMPAPRGPAEEKERACPACRSQDIGRTGPVKSEACPPGG